MLRKYTFFVVYLWLSGCVSGFLPLAQEVSSDEQVILSAQVPIVGQVQSTVSAFEVELDQQISAFKNTGFVDFTNEQLRGALLSRLYDQIPRYVPKNCTKDAVHRICGKLFLGSDKITLQLISNEDLDPQLPERPRLILFVGNIDQRIEDLAKRRSACLTSEVAEVEKQLLLADLDCEEAVCRKFKKKLGFAPEQKIESGEIRSIQRGETTLVFIPLAEGKHAKFNVFAQQFVPHKKMVFELIDQVIAKNGTVLIHCVHGWNRSLAVLAAYLHEKVGHKHSFHAITSFIAERRHGVVVLARMVCELMRGKKAGHCLLGVVEYYLGVEAQPVDVALAAVA
jgi:hypothetical protein